MKSYQIMMIPPNEANDPVSIMAVSVDVPFATCALAVTAQEASKPCFKNFNLKFISR